MNAKRKAVFLDHDGVIIEDVGYIGSESRVAFIGSVFEALRSLQDAGYLLIVVSNQSGVARGMFGLAEVFEVNEYITKKLREQGIVISASYFCPHHPTIGVAPYKLLCNCRKPNPGMLLRAISEWNIDPSTSWMIGDKLSDIQAASRAKVRGILVGDSGKKMEDIPAFADVLEATRLILHNETSQ